MGKGLTKGHAIAMLALGGSFDVLGIIGAFFLIGDFINPILSIFVSVIIGVWFWYLGYGMLGGLGGLGTWLGELVPLGLPSYTVLIVGAIIKLKAQEQLPASIPGKRPHH